METFFSVKEQTQLFLWACVIGVCLGVVYDFFRAFRIIIKHRMLYVFVEDFIFTFFFAITIFIYTTEKGRGEIRFFIFFGALLGFFIYLITIGHIVVTIIRKVVDVIYKILDFLYLKFGMPIKKLFVAFIQKTHRVIVNIALILKKYMHNNKKRLKTNPSLVYNNHNNKRIVKRRGDKNNGRKKHKKKKSKKSFVIKT